MSTYTLNQGVMNTSRYYKIRKEPLFMYNYFVEEGGMRLNVNEFNTLLGTWIQMLGMHPQEGMQKIVKYLDEKFENRK